MRGSLRRLAVAAAVAALALTTALPAQATAAPPSGSKRIGPVAGLALVATKPAASYRVAATWDVLSGATRYDVKMTDAAGVQIGSGSVTTPAWAGTTTVAVNTKVTVTVTPFAGTRRGRSKAVSRLMPDLTAPVASYSVLRNPADPTDGNVTLRRVALSDDLSAAANIDQLVDWGDGSPAQAWSSAQQDIDHAYPPTKQVYYPVVTVTDEAGNASTVDLTVAVDDSLAPTGAFTVSPTSGFAKWTKVVVGQTDIADDLSLDENIARVVDWGDGSAPQAWATGLKVSHVYAAGGAFTPTVTLTDEAGNQTAPLSTVAVAVKVDSRAPALRLRLPKLRKAFVSSWTRLRGRASDGAGVGVKVVRLRVVEKRGTTWYAYRPAAGRWVKAGKTQAGAMRKATLAKVRTTPAKTWTLRVRRLTRGTLVYKVSGLDNVGNASAWRSNKQLITRA